MKNAVWGGPSGIIHGWILWRGRGPGWMPVCYPNGAHPGWAPHYFDRDDEKDAERDISMGRMESEMEWTKKPINCKRCRVKLGKNPKDVYDRRVVK